MSLAPSEQQALARIEEALRRSDPWLDARMTTFALLTSRRRMRRWTCVSPWRLRLKQIVGVTLAVLAAGMFALSLALFGHPGRSPGRARCAVSIFLGSCPRHSARPGGGQAGMAPGRPQGGHPAR